MNSEDVVIFREGLKDAIARSHFIQGGSSDYASMERFIAGSTKCVECEAVMAIVMCRSCGDAFCELCFQKVHSRGNRSAHEGIRLRICDYCNDQSARVECQWTNKNCCYECYSMEHVRTLPQNNQNQKPRRINYSSMGLDGLDQQKSCIPNEEWIPFFDRHGVIFYYNFQTMESLRRNPLSLFADDESECLDDVSDERSDVAQRISRYTVN